MRTGLWLWLMALAGGSFAHAQGGDVRLLTGFESQTDLVEWRTQGASIRRVETNATQGQYALQLRFYGGEYPGAFLRRGSQLLAGWESYDFAKLDVFNPQPQPVNLTVRMDDAQSVNFGSRYNDGFVARPGKNTIEIPLRRLQTSDHKRNLDISQLKQWMLFASNIKMPIVLFLDNFRLERAPETTPSGTVRAFDFGPRGSPVMQGFVGVSAVDHYEKARGYGWSSTNRLWEFDDELPDSLCRGFISGDPNTKFVAEFVADVPNGTQKVVVCGQSLLGESVHVPARTCRVLANGEERVSVEVNARNFYTDEFLFRGINHDWWPGKDVWTEEIFPKFPEYIFDVVVTNGQLRLRFDTMAVHWLAIGATDQWLAAVRSARKQEFREKYFYLEPYKTPPPPEMITLNAAHGETVSVLFTVGNLQTASVAPSFPGCATQVRAVRLMEQPVGRGIYRIREMTLVSPTNHPHALRYALTVTVGKDAVAGVYRREAGGIPVELRVWPFELPASNQIDMTYGWYYGEPRDLNYYFGQFAERAADITAMRDHEFRDMVEHGFNSVTAVRSVARGDGSLDTRQADEFLAAAQGTGLVDKHPVPVETLGIARRLAHLLGIAEFDEPFLPSYQRALGAFRDWSHAKPFPVLAYVVDEPREQALNPWNRNFADTKRYLELHHAAGLQTMVTLTGDSSFGKSYLPLLGLLDVVSVHPSESSRGVLDATRNGKPALWLYNAGMNRFTFGFYPWSVGAVGRWEWHYQWWTQAYDPFARVDENAWSTGCGAVMPSPDGPVPTVAYENVRAGIDDYRFLFLLERLIRQRKSEKAEEAKRFLGEIRDRIPRFVDGTTVENTTLDGWREKIGEFIVALEGEAERNRDTGSGRPSDPPRQP